MKCLKILFFQKKLSEVMQKSIIMRLLVYKSEINHKKGYLMLFFWKKTPRVFSILSHIVLIKILIKIITPTLALYMFQKILIGVSLKTPTGI